MLKGKSERLVNLLWKIARGAIPTYYERHMRHMALSPNYTMCDAEPKSPGILLFFQQFLLAPN